MMSGGTEMDTTKEKKSYKIWMSIDMEQEKRSERHKIGEKHKWVCARHADSFPIHSP